MFVCITHGMILKAHTIKINLKYQHQHGMKNLHYQMGLFRVSDIEDYFQYNLKKHGENTDKPSIQIYVNKMYHVLKLLK